MATFSLILMIAGKAFVVDTGLSADDCAYETIKDPMTYCEVER